MKSKEKTACLLTLGIQAVFIWILFTYMDGWHVQLSVEHSWPDPHVWKAQKLGVTRNTFKLNHRTFYWNGISTAWIAVTCGLWPSPAAAVETNVNTLTRGWWQKCLDGRMDLRKLLFTPQQCLQQFSKGCSPPSPSPEPIGVLFYQQQYPWPKKVALLPSLLFDLTLLTVSMRIFFCSVAISFFSSSCAPWRKASWLFSMSSMFWGTSQNTFTL